MADLLLLRRLAPIALAATLLVSCGASGGSDAATTTTKAPKATTTSTIAASSSDAPSVDDLTALLPPASKLGQGWNDAPADTSSDTTGSKAIEEQCPDLAKVGDNQGEDNDVKGTYVGPGSAELEVSFDRTVKAYTDDEFQTIVDAVNTCKVSYTTDGSTVSLAFQAEVDPGIGDQGVKMLASATLKADGLDTPIDFKTYLYAFRRGAVGVSIQGTDGLDGQTLAVTPFDTEVLANLGPILDQGVKDLES
ncbi:MAG: hypothetical protein JWM89_3 [Acidimicrobiales bacterium]|nr:hypothetical protein [Acidimicrobiales bacterium]